MMRRGGRSSGGGAGRLPAVDENGPSTSPTSDSQDKNKRGTIVQGIAGLAAVILIVTMRSSSGRNNLRFEQMLNPAADAESSSDASAFAVRVSSAAAKGAAGETASSAETANHKDGSNGDFVLTECLHQVLQELPIGQGRLRKYKAMDRPLSFEHHMRAHTTKLWNWERRFDAIPGLTPSSKNGADGSAASQIKEEGKCAIWEVGANEKAADSEEFMKVYPQCEYHGYEPVPTFYAKLDQYWTEKKTADQSVKFTPHNFGIDASASTITATADMLDGQGTYLGGDDANKGGGGGDGADTKEGSMQLVIKSFANALADSSNGLLPTLFHVNCEGCEWDMLQNLLTSGDDQEDKFRRIPVIQFGTHNYGKTVGQRAWELCQIRQELSKTHEMVYGVAFAWERWVIKKK